MAEVSVLGLGPMGMALARALLGGGHRVTVWNRTAAKAGAQTYDNPGSSMKTCAASGDLFLKQAREAGISTAFPSFLVGLYDKCMAAGYGNERLPALMKVLREDGNAKAATIVQ